MNRRITLTLAESTTDTECGECDYASFMPCGEPFVWLCTRPEFARRTPSGGYETAERPGRRRIPECIAAEQADVQRERDAALGARVREVERDKERAEAALALVAPDALPFQLFLDDGVPMFGRVSLVSPYLFATKPEGPDTAFAGAREVYQYTYDEDTQHEAEHCTVGYFVTEDWLCERDEGAEEKYDEALARAELAETKHASCEAHLRLVTEERERFAEQREDWRARSIANEERAEQAEKERDALKLIASDLARRHVEASEAKRDEIAADRDRWKALAEALQPITDRIPSARDAARRRMPLDGADAQALEHAVTMTERERDAMLPSAEVVEQMGRAASRFASEGEDVSEWLAWLDRIGGGS